MRSATIQVLLFTIGMLLITNAVIIYPYRHDLYLLWLEGFRCLTLVTK
jgi:hypothetical protein